VIVYYLPTMAVTYDSKGYLFTLMRDGVPKTYKFPEHTVSIHYASTWPSSPELKRELNGILDKPAGFEHNNGIIYYIRALPLVGEPILVWIVNAAEANILTEALRKIGR